MSDRTLSPRLTAGTIALLHSLESTGDPVERLTAIDTLADQGDSDCCRALIGAYERAMWRETKLAIIVALGRTNQQRAIEFLLACSADTEDLAIASEAVLALGSSESVVAAEYLLTLLRERDHPLRREAVIALTHMSFFPCEGELVRLLDEDLPPVLLQYVILGLGRRRQTSVWPRLLRLLDLRGAQHDPVANSVLVAAGQLGDRQTIGKLRACNTRHRFFEDQLKFASLEQIHLRLRRTIEDVIGAILEAEEPHDRWQALYSLRHFAPALAWEAFELLGAEASLNVQAQVRLILFDPARAVGDREFLILHWKNLDLALVAGLVRLHANSKPGFLAELYTQLETRQAIQLMNLVKESAALERLDKIVADPQISPADRILAVNAVVSQVLMVGKSSPAAKRAGELVFRRIAQVPESLLQQRLIRALGQIGYAERAVFIGLERLLREKSDAQGSIYFTLALLAGEDAAKIVLRRMADLLKKSDCSDEIDQAISALSKMGTLPNVELLRQLPAPNVDGQKQSMLQILANNRIVGFESLIAEGLLTPAYQTVMLAIAAARMNPSPAIWQMLFGYLDQPDSCLSGRALDSLCVGGGTAQHVQLLRRISGDLREREYALKVFGSIRPQLDGDYRELVAILDQLLVSKKQLFLDREVSSAAVTLRDNLVFAARQPQRVAKPTLSEVSSGSAPHIQEIDRGLSSQMKAYPHYSETVKSTLRNAELTCKHPELFDHRVDKSTAVVEYVKCIDLLLQEKLGLAVFLRSGSKLLSSMQSRIVRLELDSDEQSAGQIALDLQCHSHFDGDSFPSHKLSTMARAILSGKILRDQHRTIDGLRAWAIMFLIFGRDFSFRSVRIEPLFTVKIADNMTICRIARGLSSLQEVRNEAAHRGTIIRVSEVEEVRETSFQLLRDLSEILP